MTNINTTIEQEMMTECCSANFGEAVRYADADPGSEEFARCDACGEMATIINAAEIL